MNELLTGHLFNWIILPILIFCARVLDVSIGTLRIILMARGKRKLAPLLAFFEILVWLIAIRQIFSHLNNPACYIAYAGGFATGNYVGLWLDEKLALGYQVVRIITRHDATRLISCLKEKGVGITRVDAEGRNGKVEIIFTVIPRRDLPGVLNIIKQFNPRAFYSVEDVRLASEGIFPLNHHNHPETLSRWLRWEKKAK